MSAIANWYHKIMPNQYIPILVIVAIQFVATADAVVMPPRLLSRKDGITNETHVPVVEDDVPYIISIRDEQTTKKVEKNSASFIIVNINRILPYDVTVTLMINNSDLLSFNKLSSNHTIIKKIVFNKDFSGDEIVNFYSSNRAGHALIICKVENSHDIIIDDSGAYISVDISNSPTLDVFIDIVGWIYFAAWSLSFYFQVILNFRRKSVVGLNFDFLALNAIGFACYTIYNFSLMFSDTVQNDYYRRHNYSRIPVEYNDLFFAAHALLITLVTVAQCFIYERAQQKVSLPATLFITASSVVGLILYLIQFFGVVTLLDVVTYLSYVKLAITVIKYTPQAWMNYKRKTTSGWSIHNILLDFTGGILSMTQMFLLAYNYDEDWSSIFGNFTKFGLGLISIMFDIVFVIQHYVLYGEREELGESTDSVPGPVISRSVMSTNNSTPSADDGQTSEENLRED